MPSVEIRAKIENISRDTDYTEICIVQSEKHTAKTYGWPGKVIEIDVTCLRTFICANVNKVDH